MLVEFWDNQGPPALLQFTLNEEPLVARILELASQYGRFKSGGFEEPVMFFNAWFMLGLQNMHPAIPPDLITKAHIAPVNLESDRKATDDTIYCILSSKRQ